MRDMLRRITLIAAQNQEDGDRFIELGLNARSYRNRQPEIRYLRHPGAGRPRRYIAPPMGAAPPGVIATSTHDGEETIPLEAHRKLLENTPTCC